MAKKTTTEQILSDFKKGLKTLTKEIERLQSALRSKEDQIYNLNQSLELARNSIESKIKETEEKYNKLFLELVGDNIENYLVGYGFEKHVVWWMNKYFSKYVLRIWQGDKCTQPYEEEGKISAAWNTFPDLVYMNDECKRIIALECKYRYDGRLTIDKKHYENYKRFEQQLKTLMNIDARVYIMAGSRGTSSERPDFMYCIPIDFFENQNEVDLRKIPQYKVMERDLYNPEIINYNRNIQF